MTPRTAGGSRWAAQNTVDKVGVAAFKQPNSSNTVSTDFDDGSATNNTPSGGTDGDSRFGDVS